MGIFETLKKEKFYYFAIIILFLFGLYLRLKTLLLDICFQSDEIWIIQNFYKSYLGLLQPLENNQIVPVGFLFIEKFLYNISSQDMFLKLQAFSWGVLALAFFPVFATKFLKNKCIILMSYFMFVIHFPLIVYSTVAKSYITDVFFTMLIITLFTIIDLKKDSTKKLLMIGFALALSFWFSVTSIFVFVSSLTAFAIYNYKSIKISKIHCLLTPIGISLFLYVIWGINIYNAHYSFMLHWWFTVEKSLRNYNFLNQIQKEFNLTNLFCAYTITKFMKYTIYCVLLLIGILVSKSKKALYILLPIFTMLVCHLLTLYPIHLRLTLYIVPIFILFLFIPFETVSKIYSKIVILFSITFLLFNQMVYLHSDAFIKLMNTDWMQGNSCTDEKEFANMLKESKYYNENDSIYLLYCINDGFLPDAYVYHLNREGIKYNKVIIKYEEYENFVEEIKKNRSCWIMICPDFIEQLKQEKFIKVIEEYKHKSYAKFEDSLLYVNVILPENADVH